jgi:hypothetical protein
MLNSAQSRLIFHGSVVLLVALSCGLPSVVEVSAGTTRMWQAAHSALLLMSVWMFAQAAILGLILLKTNELTVLTWGLVATGYSLSFAAVVQAVTGVRGLGPSPSPVHMTVFIANLVVVLGSVLTASITLLGAKNAIAKLEEPTHSNPGSASAVNTGV